MVRKEIEWFAEEMEAKLAKYDHKGGWDKLTIPHLINRVKDELKELEEELDNKSGIVDIEAAVKECADTSNFLMMVAYNLKTGRNECT